nr:hypothetical protein [Xylophilus rhododendri]
MPTSISSVGTFSPPAGEPDSMARARACLSCRYLGRPASARSSSGASQLPPGVVVEVVVRVMDYA